VSATDVFATLIELMGLEAEVPVESRSLRPLWHPESGRYDRDWVVVQVSKPLRLELAARRRGLKYIARTHLTHAASPLHDRSRSDRLPAPGPELQLVDHLLAFGRDLAPDEAPRVRARKRRGAEEELYDLRSDPRELRNLERARREMLASARAALKRELLVIGQEADRASATRDAVQPLSEEERGSLRALGYLE
jgi:arylsulfatase A-like enzyme